MKKNEKKLKEILYLFLSKKELKKGFLEIKIKMLWKEIMGKLINVYTEKILIKNQVLYIKLKSSELREDLLYQKKKIINKINKNLKQKFIKNIFFY